MAEHLIDKLQQAKALRERAREIEAERKALLDVCTSDERPFVDVFFDAPPDASFTGAVDGWQAFGLRRPGFRRISANFVAVISVVAALPLVLLALDTFDPSPIGSMVAIGTIFFAVLVVLSVTIDFPSLWRNVSLVLESGSFYFFAGLALLIFAQRGSDAREHPSITFILAMLGVAILLFGTGSQATGALATQGAKLPPLPPLSRTRGSTAGSTVDAEPTTLGTTSEPPQSGTWGPLKANAIVAGGAAVLTIVFGFGVIYYRDQIPRVFNDYGEYQRIVVRPCYTTGHDCVASDFQLKEVTGGFDFRSYEVTASNAEGEDLFVRKSPGGFQILALPGEDLKVGRLVQIKLERSNPSFADSDYESSISLTLQLPDQGVQTASVENARDQDEDVPCLVPLNRQSGNCRIALMRQASDNREAKTTMNILSLNLVKEAGDGALRTEARPAPDVPRDSLTESALSSVAVEFQ